MHNVRSCGLWNGRLTRDEALGVDACRCPLPGATAQWRAQWLPGATVGESRCSLAKATVSGISRAETPGDLPLRTPLIRPGSFPTRLVRSVMFGFVVLGASLRRLDLFRAFNLGHPLASSTSSQQNRRRDQNMGWVLEDRGRSVGPHDGSYWSRLNGP